ncbi:MAG: hypothetical protein OXL38_08835 [Gammaproteobacteria bacterium]|nr:hypothetical protein [Gammaproteobacteria bacterium]
MGLNVSVRSCRCAGVPVLGAGNANGHSLWYPPWRIATRKSARSRPFTWPGWAIGGALAPMLMELALAHNVGDAVECVYARSDLLARPRDLMDAWARFVTAAPANVLDFSNRS